VNSRLQNESERTMQTSIIKLLMITAGLLCPAIVAANGYMPPEFTIEYSLHKGDTTVGTMTRSLKHLGNSHYEFESSSETTGFVALFYKRSIRELTSWQIHDDQFFADEYHYSRIKKGKQREVNINFNWEDKKIITRVNDSSWSMPIEEPVYDKLLYQIALMHDLKAGRPTDNYRIADGGRMKDYFFEIVGRDVIQTRFGDFESIKIIRRKDNREDKAVLWCVPSLHYLPVRVDNYDDEGSVITAHIKQIDGLTIEAVNARRSAIPGSPQAEHSQATSVRLPDK